VRVVIVGPGKIGCGYLAPLFAGAEWEVTLAARSDEMTERIQSKGAFDVLITGDRGERFAISHVQAATVGSQEFVEEVARADLVVTSVGVANVSGLGEPLAVALGVRSRPVDVWVVENGRCAGVLEEMVRESAAARGLALPPVGFAGAVAKVAVSRGSWRDPGRPIFVGDGARELMVDEWPLRTELPSLSGVRTTSQYPARLREKLYVFNAGHAICAYLGWLRGHGTISEAAADSYLRPMIVGTMLESRRALLEAYPALGTDVRGPVAEALSRFANAQLGDPVCRVARDPIRKLGPGDRLLGPVGLIRKAIRQVPSYFALGVAGALLFRNDDDHQATELRGRLARDGVMAVLREVCRMDEADPFARAVAERYRGFVFTDDGTMFPPAHLSGENGEAQVVPVEVAP
jgi:mannitol-1-phosphate 5-dehydrogenase